MMHPCTDGCCLDDRHVQPCIGNAVFMMAVLLSWYDGYCLMRGNITMILWYLALMVATFFERYAAVFKFIQFVIICTCCSTIVNCTMLFWIFSFLMELKKKPLQTFTIFQNLIFSLLSLETLSNLDLISFTKEIVTSTKNCSIVHICNKLSFIQKVWIY